MSASAPLLHSFQSCVPFLEFLVDRHTPNPAQPLKQVETPETKTVKHGIPIHLHVLQAARPATSGSAGIHSPWGFDPNFVLGSLPTMPTYIFNLSKSWPTKA